MLPSYINQSVDLQKNHGFVSERNIGLSYMNQSVDLQTNHGFISEGNIGL